MKEKAFGIFIALSLLWHLLWTILITVVVLPVEFSLKGFPVVSFLGPILEDKFFNEIMEEKPLDILPFKDEAVKVTVDLPEIVNPDNITTEVQKEKIDVSYGLNRHKEIPAYREVELDKKLYETQLIEVTGPARYREILYKPILPEYPEWAEEMGMDFDIDVRFSVSQEGEVKNVSILTSSGEPQVDLLGAAYLKRWRFVSLSKDASKKEEWGIIKIHFRLKKGPED